jgi:hypothetical protein
MSQSWDYLRWNQALGHHFFHPGKAGQDVFLAADRSVLQRVSGMEAKQAEESFLHVIRSVCGPQNPSGWNRSSLAYFKQDPLNFRPPCTGLLCFQVYVAFQMEAIEGERSAYNYWGVMNELLGYELGSPPPVAYDIHQGLWRDSLERWANNPMYQGGRLGHLVLPPEGGHFQHIRLPLSQALLTKEDCLRLGSFFYAADLRPGDEVETSTLYELLLSTSLETRLTNHAWRVLDDELRREAALAQIVDELSEWDGSSVDRPKLSVYKMWLRFSKRRPERCRAGIARVCQDSLENEIGAALHDLLEREIVLEGVRYRPPMNRQGIRLLVRNDSLGCYLEQRYLGPGQEALLLLSGSMAQLVLQEFAHKKIPHEEVPIDLPRMWKAIWLETPAPLPPLAKWLEFIEPGKISLRPFGGIKLRPGVWMAGTGPQIRVVGNELPQSAWIGGHLVPVQNGVLQHSCLNEPGLHLVVLPGRANRTYLHVEEPDQLASVNPSGWGRAPSAWPIPCEATSNQLDLLQGFQVLGDWPAYCKPVPQKPILISATPVAPVPPPAAAEIQPIATPQSEQSIEQAEAHQDSQDPLDQTLVVKMLVSLRRGVPLVTKEEIDAARQHPHPVVRALSQRLQSMAEQPCR